MSKGITVNAGNVHSIFEKMKKHADKVAHAVGVIIDVEMLWMVSTEAVEAAREAVRINMRGLKGLSIYDKRTTGGKYFERARRKFREEMLTRYRDQAV